MRAIAFIVAVSCCQFIRGAELPLFFNSGSNFKGTIIHHKIQGDPSLEARYSRVNEKITLRMLTLESKAVVLVADRVGTEHERVYAFQITNDDKIFAAGKSALDEKAQQFDKAAQANNPNFRSDVYQPRDYTNKDLIVAARLPVGGTPLGVEPPTKVVVVLHPRDKSIIEGEFLVLNPDKTISEDIWFDVKREEGAQL